jgi:hypothetical protein
MLDGAERNGFASIISWQPHGKAFLIHKPDAFAASVLPKYFEGSKLTSFQRQLYIYGFQRIKNKNSPDCKALYHELFCRGHQSLSMRMKREKIRGRKRTLLTEPNFYSESRVSANNICNSTKDISRTTVSPSSSPVLYPSTKDISGTTVYPSSSPVLYPSNLERNNIAAEHSEESLGSSDCWIRAEHLFTSIQDNPSSFPSLYIPQMVVPNVNNDCSRRKDEETISYEAMVFCGKPFFSIRK